MIPKVIHYCWFGRNPLPKLAIRCIESWKKHLPDYKIIEWNEDNFNVNIIPYTAEAYRAKKFAFVSDYARFWILHKYGGLYFDTDVEIIRPINDIITKGPFMGFEQPSEEVKQTSSALYDVAPGLALGATPGLAIYKELLDHYQNLHFLGNDGKPIPVTIVKHTTDVLKTIRSPRFQRKCRRLGTSSQTRAGATYPTHSEGRGNKVKCVHRF